MSIKHTFKTGTGLQTKNLTAMKAIRYKCKDCSNWFDPEIKNCSVKDCALYPFRRGRTEKDSESS